MRHISNSQFLYHCAIKNLTSIQNHTAQSRYPLRSEIRRLKCLTLADKTAFSVADHLPARSHRPLVPSCEKLRKKKQTLKTFCDS